MSLPSPVCLWRALMDRVTRPFGIPISGHRSRLDYEGPAHVEVIVCNDCGKVTVMWSPLAPRKEAP